MKRDSPSHDKKTLVQGRKGRSDATSLKKGKKKTRPSGEGIAFRLGGKGAEKGSQGGCPRTVAPVQT